MIHHRPTKEDSSAERRVHLWEGKHKHICKLNGEWLSHVLLTQPRSLLHILSHFYSPSIYSSPPNLFSSVTSFNYPSPVIFYSFCSVFSLFFFHLFCPPLTCQVPNCTSWPFHLNSFFFPFQPVCLSLFFLFILYFTNFCDFFFLGYLLLPPSLSTNLCSVIFHSSSDVFPLNWASMEKTDYLVWI